MLIRPSERGFSLIELMVAVAIMVLLALLAAPSMRLYIENSKILGATELLYASAQQARTEAIRRNLPVELIFTDAAPTSASVDTTDTNTSGPNWLVRQTPLPGTDDHIFIEARAGAEGGGRAGGSTSTVIAASMDSIRFNAAGALAGGGTATVDLSSTVGSCAPGGETRCLRVVVSSGGQVRLCDPAVSAANDTRRC